MLKAKKYDWKDSNMALFGSDTEKKVKKESAETEPAWQGAGAEVGLQIWRINKFKVEAWPKEDYGNFYSGDSYIILNTFKEEDGDELKYDVHFWIGKYSTQDEYGTAAYKTVELDTFLDDKPVQHRQVCNHESNLFKSYFPSLTRMKGGVDTGFNRVLPEEYTPRFFHVKKVGPRRITSTQVSLKTGNYSEDDVFILDLGLDIYQINGENCSHDEKFAAAQEMQKILGTRPRAKKHNLDGSPMNHGQISGYFKDSTPKEKVVPEWGGNKLFEVSEEDGSDAMEQLDGASRDMLNSNNVYILDSKDAVFCWVGSGASIDERKNGLPYACHYIKSTDDPYRPVTVVAEGKETAEFNAAW